MRRAAVLFSVLSVSAVARAEHGAAPRPTARPRAAAAVPASYAQAMIGWHAAPQGAKQPTDARGKPMLVFKSLAHNERVEVSAATDRGGFSASDLDRVAHILRSASGDEHPMDPRTIDIVYRIQTHFGAPEIRIISGYRVPKPTSHSNHGKGRAIDFILPGVSDADVAKFAREIGFVGVGIYPTSQFVHVDIRPRSYFWVDNSGPGKRNRERGILGDLAQRSDTAALQRGEKAIEPFEIGENVEVALRARAPQAPPHDDDDDDD